MSVSVAILSLLLNHEVHSVSSIHFTTESWIANEAL